MAAISFVSTGRAMVTRRGYNQAQLVNILRALRNRFAGTTGLAVGTTTTRLKTTVAAPFNINGYILGPLTPADPFGPAFTGLGLVNTIAAQFCKIRIEVNTAGTVTYKQGGIAANQSEARHAQRTPSMVTVGWIEVPASFTFGTTPFTQGMLVEGDPDLDQLALEA